MHNVARPPSFKGHSRALAHGCVPFPVGRFAPLFPVGSKGRKGEAEDHFKVIGLFGTVTAPDNKNALLTQEWTPLEPGTIDHKLYVRDIGTVLEQTERGGNERNELVSITTG